MQYFYGQTSNSSSNFGIALNRWLWPQLSPQLFEEQVEEQTPLEDQAQANTSEHSLESSPVFVGAGTLLNKKLLNNKLLSDGLLSDGLLSDGTIGHSSLTTKLVIFGTGVGYELPLSAIPIAWDIRCLRGPLSAQRLGLPANKAITDSGLLIAQVFETSGQQTDQRASCSFMPHVSHANIAAENWQRISQQAGVRYIDPRWTVEKILQAIAASDRLLTESLYGAIAAEALRIPWIPVVSSPRIYSFKWQDWCASLNLFYHPYRLPPLKAYSRYHQSLQAARHWLEAVLEGPVSTHQYELLADESAIALRLANIAKQAPSLSTETIFSQKLDALQTCFNQLCKQYARDTVMH